MTQSLKWHIQHHDSHHGALWSPCPPPFYTAPTQAHSSIHAPATGTILCKASVRRMCAVYEEGDLYYSPREGSFARIWILRDTPAATCKVCVRSAVRVECKTYAQIPFSTAACVCLSSSCGIGDCTCFRPCSSSNNAIPHPCNPESGCGRLFVKWLKRLRSG